jgi:glycosyltransferase involved in cell wall biosynthesis
MKFVGKRILIISPERWGINRISKHHYAIALAQRGNQVYFLNPPSQGLKQASLSQTEIAGLFQIDYTPVLKGLNKVLTLSEWLFALLNSFDIRKIQKILPGQPDVVWSFDPFRFQNLKQFNTQISIFHPVDYHPGTLDLKVAKTADIILSVSPVILDKYRSVNKPLFFINHGVSSVFLDQKRVLGKIDSKIRCGYVGNLLSFAIDWANLLQIVRENDQVEFHFIGPYSKNNLGHAVGTEGYINQLKMCKNVILHGALSPEDVSLKIQSFDFFLICYNAEVYDKVVSNSHKILEYLSTGKVVVASRTTTYEQLAEGVIEMVRDSSELRERFKGVANSISTYNSEEEQRKRIEFSKRNGYDNHLIEIEDIISKHINKTL